jgi:hypothetical protein
VAFMVSALPVVTLSVVTLLVAIFALEKVEEIETLSDVTLAWVITLSEATLTVWI